jgi:hypothetical protein
MRLTPIVPVLVALLWPCWTWAQSEGTLFNKETGEPLGVPIEKLLTDNAAGAVSAASLAGVESDSMTVVDNVRDFSLLIKGFDASARAFGIAITPARTPFPFPSYTVAEYGARGAYLTRLVASLTLSYAQGKADIEGSDFTRRAISVATSGFWRVDEDPVVAVAKARECGHAALDAMGDDRPSLTQEEIDRLVEEAQQGGSRGQTARRARRAAEDQEIAAKQAWDDCVTPILKRLEAKWNRSRYAISFGTGTVKRSDGSGDAVNLGRTLAVTVLYGFDGVDALKLKDRAAMTLTVRRSEREPVLASLVAGSVQYKSSTLVALRLSGGSSVFRGLVEANNAKDTNITTTQHTFRRALGIDFRVTDGLWLNLRYGKQRKLDGSGQNETGSFLALNYSPSAMLGR